MPIQEENKFDITVIGGGPAGIMAALSAARTEAKVALLEKNSELSKKLLLTGNGRCNICNAEFNLRNLIKNYSKGAEFLFHAFSFFGPERTIKYFEGIGIKTKIEKNNRVFPASESAEDVREALIRELEKNKVKVILNAEVLKIANKGKKIQKLILKDKREIKAGQYILCTGGSSFPKTGSDGSGYKLAEALGHSITKIQPALVPIVLKDGWVKDLQGVGLKNVKISVKLEKNQESETGDLLFTHFGISGPAVLNISKKVGLALNSKTEVKILIDLAPLLNFAQLEKKITNDLKSNPRKSLKKYLSSFMPERMAVAFGKIFNMDLEINTSNMSRNQRTDLVRNLKNFEVTATGLLGLDEAMITSGGISLNEIDHKTMKSKIADNLFFAGEIIGVDAKTGGFNLQTCWSTGHLAGKSAFIFLE